MDQLHPGLKGRHQIPVTHAVTADAEGHEGVEVLSTPKLVLAMEMACDNAIRGRLPPGFTHVGIFSQVRHLAATPLGMTVTAEGELVAVEGRRLVFEAQFHDDLEKIGEGHHERVLMEWERVRRRWREKKERFLSIVVGEAPFCPPKPLGLDHIVLKVKDLERALSFYTGTLGLNLVEQTYREHKEGKRPFVSLRAGDQLVDLVPDPGYVPPQESQRNLPHFCLLVEPPQWDSFLEFLKEKGLKPLGPPRERLGAQGMGLSIYIQDPDGNTVEVKAR